MGGSESKESRKTKELAIEGVQFEPVNNKCLRLYFESRKHYIIILITITNNYNNY